MPFFSLSQSQYIRTVRLSAAYDLAVTWVFALPWTFAWIYALFSQWGASLGLPGQMTELNASHMLMANLLGSVVVVWAVARWLQPSLLLGRLDATARALFAIWQIYAVTQGVNAIVLGFTVFEIIFGLLQLARVRNDEVASL